MIDLIKLEKKSQNKKILIIGVFHGDEPQGECFINSYLKTSSKIGKNSLYFIPKLIKRDTMKLKEYNTKRDFKKTKEPIPLPARQISHGFHIQAIHNLKICAIIYDVKKYTPWPAPSDTEDYI